MKILFLLVAVLVLSGSAAAISVSKAPGYAAAPVNVTASPVVTFAHQPVATIVVTPVVTPVTRQTTAVPHFSPVATIAPVRTGLVLTQAGETTRPTSGPSLQRTLAADLRGTTVPTPQPGSAVLNIATDPAGATARIDTTVTLTTPGAANLSAGTHGLVITLPGYFPYVATVSLPSGSVTGLSVPLSTISPLNQTIPSAVARLTVHTIPEGGFVRIGGLNQTAPMTADFLPGTYPLSVGKAGYLGQTQSVSLPDGGTWQTLFINLTPQGMPGNAICLSGEQCLTPAEAAAYYPGQWWYKTSPVCDYAIVDGQSVPRYCTQGESGQNFQVGAAPVAVLARSRPAAMVTFQPTDTVTAVPSAAGTPAPGGQRGVIESFFGFFSGIFHP